MLRAMICVAVALVALSGCAQEPEALSEPSEEAPANESGSNLIRTDLPELPELTDLPAEYQAEGLNDYMAAYFGENVPLFGLENLDVNDGELLKCTVSSGAQLGGWASAEEVGTTPPVIALGGNVDGEGTVRPCVQVDGEVFAIMTPLPGEGDGQAWLFTSAGFSYGGEYVGNAQSLTVETYDSDDIVSIPRSEVIHGDVEAGLLTYASGHFFDREGRDAESGAEVTIPTETFGAWASGHPVTATDQFEGVTDIDRAPSAVDLALSHLPGLSEGTPVIFE